MKTALIILNYNNASDTLNCLRSVEAHNSAPVVYVVVDNGSAVADVDALAQGMRDIFGDDFADIVPGDGAKAAAVLLRLPENVGYACGNNAGLEWAYAHAGCENVMILNNDILFVEDIIPTLLRQMQELPDCGIISPVLFKKGMSEYDLHCARRAESVGHMVKHNFLHYYWRARGMQQWDAQPDLYLLLDEPRPEHGLLQVQLPSGSCMLMRAEVMRKIGGFDPRTFLYYEENILYAKLQREGLKVYVDLDCRCIHLGAATTSHLPNSLWLRQCAQRSARIYVDEYSGASAPERWLLRLSQAWDIAAFRLQKALQIKRK